MSRANCTERSHAGPFYRLRGAFRVRPARTNKVNVRGKLCRSERICYFLLGDSEIFAEGAMFPAAFGDRGTGR
jgi:hypothetical protein